MIRRLITALFLIVCCGQIPTLRGEAPQTVEQAVAWLQAKSSEMIPASRRTMNNGIAAFPPQVGSGYEAFWLRDYAYMLEGCPEAFTDKELRDACLVFVNAQQADGAYVDCVKFDGTPIYKPGYGRMGENPVADGSQFTVDVAWHTHRRLQDRQLVQQIIDRLVKAMEVVPRNPTTGLVLIDPSKDWDRCPYGFTDTVRKKGEVLFCSLLYLQAAQQLADLLGSVERTEQAQTWRHEANRVATSVRDIFWDESVGLFRAATSQCREHDLWGSAFAVYLGATTPQQSLAIATYFRVHYPEIVQRGQLRHLPGGVYWQQAGPKDKYQNGGYWATPIGWFVYTLDLVDPRLADQTLLDLVNDFQRRGVTEWVFGEHTAIPNYLASATLPLVGAKRMLERRQARE